MQRLTINNSLRESDAVQCRHGCELEGNEARLCLEFVNAFNEEYRARACSGDNDLGLCLDAGWNATETEDKFSDIWGSATKLRSYYVAQSVQYLLNGNDNDNDALLRDASVAASFAKYFEQRIEVFIYKTQPIIKWHKIAELQHSDIHTLVSFLRKRIPCKCLDEKYKQVKSMTKMGRCCNNECFLSDKQVARSEMFCCDGCHAVFYCCHGCQKVHWPQHKEQCKKWARERAEFV